MQILERTDELVTDARSPLKQASGEGHFVIFDRCPCKRAPHFYVESLL